MVRLDAKGVARGGTCLCVQLPSCLMASLREYTKPPIFRLVVYVYMYVNACTQILMHACLHVCMYICLHGDVDVR